MQTLQPADFQEFSKQTERGNVVPVTLTVAADLQTPFGAYLLVSENSEHSFLLESVEGGANLARYSFLGANPQKIASGIGNTTIVEQNGEQQILPENIIDFLRKHFAGKQFAAQLDSPFLSGGAVGFFNFSSARLFEPVLQNNSNETENALWMFFRTVIAFDHARQQIKITTIVFTEDAEENAEKLEKLYQNAVLENRKLARKLEERPFLPISKIAEEQKPFASNWKREDFENAVREIQEQILAGNCYQVVLSQRFDKETAAAPEAIYRILRSLNPSPYMFLLESKEKSVIGASPEMLVRCRGSQVEYRPIAGTRKRGVNEIEDAQLAEEMRQDTKEVAEHLMLVDLGRNDLGRVAEFGSVKVEKLMNVEKYSHVQHLVSYLKAELKNNCDRFDALASCFPAGTVSGAPKVRAMQIIQQLEPDERGVYAGAVGYVDYAENLDTCIAIRTLVLQNGVASVQAGAGIVADSIPAREYEETVHKAQALLKAIEIAETQGK